MKDIVIAKNKNEVYNFKGVGIVVDFFRFSTTVSALVYRNKNVKIYSDEKKVLKNFRYDKNFDIFSEKYFLVNKFDNSPYLALNSDIKENVVVITNSGSKAVLALKNATKIIIASFCNISYVKSAVNFENYETMIVPACIFFDRSHVEDFIVSKFIKDFFEDRKIDIKIIRNEIEKSGRIDDLKKLRETADKDIDIIFSMDKFDVVPLAIIRGDFAEVINEKSHSKLIRRS